MQQPMNQPKRHGISAGWGLMEALAALSVLSLGLLGLLWMQGKSVLMWRTQHAGEQAAWLAQDMAERVRANRSQLNFYRLSWGQAPASVDCSSQACTLAQWALSDLYAWTLEVQARLPGAQTQLWISPSDPQYLGIALAWRETDKSVAEMGALAPGLVCPDQHRCFFVHVRP